MSSSLGPQANLASGNSPQNLNANGQFYTEDYLMGPNPNNPSFVNQNTYNNLDPGLSPPINRNSLGPGSAPPLQASQGVHQLGAQPALPENNPVPESQHISNTEMANELIKGSNVFHLAPAGDLVSLQKSNLFTNNDRFMAENYLMEPLKAGGGPLGIQRIILDEKIQLLNLDKNKYLTNDQILEKLRIDGVYVDDPQIYQKFTDINVQKLEERILREKKFTDNVETTLMQADIPHKTNYFKVNGEIKLHNDLLADEITRPSDLAFEQSEAYQLKEVNSILSNRLHSFKKRYYRLDIVVGKVSLLKYPQFFANEDKLAIELRELYKEFERRTSLAMIPFYKDRLKFIEDQQYTKMRNPLTPKEELDFLQQNFEETQRKLEQEKREVQDLAQNVYNKWKAIKEIRKTNQFASTNVKMKVHKNEESGEFYFNLMHEEPSGKKYNGTALPNSEINRRNSAMRIRAYVRLIINGKYVSRTRKAFLKWPNFEIEIGEQFQVHLFTMPSQIQLEIVIGTFKETLVDVIDVEVPGRYVKALTSASSLVKEMAFSKCAFERKKAHKKFIAQQKLSKPEELMSDAQKKKMAEEQKRLEEEEKKAQEMDVKGVLYLKAEWKGEGPEMPPMRSENIFRQKQAQKVRKHYTEDEQQRMLLRQLYIDVNDPRNERIIRFIKETKNEFLIKLLQEDAKNPLASTQPFRHMLLEARARDPEFAKEIIPMLEREIIQNPYLLDKLEVLFREKAYREYLERKVEEERNPNNSKVDAQGNKVFISEYEDNALKYDAECIRRRQVFFDKLKQYQREVKAGHQKASTQYKSIVREFELLESENPLIALFNKMFITGRKLRPIIQKRQPVALDAAKEAKIIVHVIKGFNVPIRNLAKQRILSMYQGGPGFVSTAQNPYNNRSGPFAVSVNQFDRGMPPMGATGQLDVRSSMGARSGFGGNFGQDPSMRSFPQNRMTNGIPLNNQPVQGGFQKGDIRNLTEDQLRSLYRTARVEPFIEVRIVYNEEYSEVKMTNIAEGDFPEWNEILEFPLQALNGKKFTKHELVNTKSMIYITLFDREIIMQGTGQIQFEQQFRYLGSFCVPLIAVLNNPPKIDAIFKINRPMALFNYQVETNRFFFLNSEGGAVQVKTEVPHTYLSMQISLDPVLELPQDNEMEYYPGRESSALLIASSEWVKKLKKGGSRLEKRYIKVFGENVDGHSILLCRYITPQAPPLDIYDAQTQRMYQFAIEKAARYVSLIPFIEDSQAFNEMPDLYCNSQEFLDLGAGDIEEHAILLCNYFNYIDIQQGRQNVKSYVILGTGFPEGRTAYVMRRDTTNNHVELWNPMKGEAYFYGRKESVQQVACFNISRGFKNDKNLNDAICQLRSIGCVIGSDNVWANTQEYDDPGLISYDLNNAACWKPFFTKSNFNKYFPGGSIRPEQPEKIQYMKPMESERMEVIADKIQHYISEKFENERIRVNKMRTKWNNEMEVTLREILANCEMVKQKQRQGATNSSLREESLRNQGEDVTSQINNIQQQINQNARGQRVWGFPINVTFVSLPLLWEEVKNTKIHMVYDDDAEFSLYVYVYPYPHNVLSVWFYILVLTKDKRKDLQF